jgi:hypothetical protein
MPIVIAGVSLDGANEYRQQRFCTSSTVVDKLEEKLFSDYALHWQYKWFSLTV